MKVRLIVIRTKEPQKLAEFYSLMGLAFEYHKHGNSPYHYSATVNGLVFEIYPLTKTQIEADKHMRLGFEIDNFDETLVLLRERGFLLSEPTQTDFGTIAIASDHDGRKIELYKN
ncbi:VOC family protein [Emticicia fontis]